MAAIGLSHAAREIANEGKHRRDRSKADNIKPGKRNDMSLQAIPEDFQSSQSELNTNYTTHHELGGDKDSAWDMVAKGRALTDAYERERQFLEDEALGLNREKGDLHWEIVNVSAGGYCLRWNSDTTSRAQIGELIALREKEPDGSHSWRIGVIRWMQFTRENGLEIGIQVLSPRVMAATAQRSHRPNEEPFDCLILPEIKPLKQPPTILLPAHAFRQGNGLKIEMLKQEMEVKLGSVKEHTGSFTQFQFTAQEEVEKLKQMEKKKSDATSRDNFDEIWSSL